MKSIPLQLTHSGPAPAASIEVDGARVAARLGMDVDAFRQLMHDGKVSVLCERGIGEDAGLHRATFYYQARRVRMVVDDAGHILRDDA